MSNLNTDEKSWKLLSIQFTSFSVWYFIRKLESKTISSTNCINCIYVQQNECNAKKKEKKRKETRKQCDYNNNGVTILEKSHFRALLTTVFDAKLVRISFFLFCNKYKIAFKFHKSFFFLIFLFYFYFFNFFEDSIIGVKKKNILLFFAI